MAITGVSDRVPVPSGFSKSSSADLVFVDTDFSGFFSRADLAMKCFVFDSLPLGLNRVAEDHTLHALPVRSLLCLFSHLLFLLLLLFRLRNHSLMMGKKAPIWGIKMDLFLE